jgi:anti-sigma B factor antagonist
LSEAADNEPPSATCESGVWVKGMTPAGRKPLRLEVERSAQGIVVRIRGTVGTEDAHRLQEKLEELAVGTAPLIVLDMEGMDFISSMGLAAIIAGHLKARRHDGEIRVVGARPAIAQLLETTRLTKLFTSFPTTEEALAAPRSRE